MQRKILLDKIITEDMSGYGLVENPRMFVKNIKIASDFGGISVYILNKKYFKKRKEKSMQSYSDLGGNSGVEAFEIGADYIKVLFKTSSKVYTYSYSSAGREKVEQMKILALQGHGLNSYIMRYARNDYEK